MRETKAPSRFTEDLDHYFVVFKEDNVKGIVSQGELRNCNEVAKGASCEALWKDANHTGWYPAFIVDIGDLDHLRSVQLNKPKAENKNLPASRTTCRRGISQRKVQAS